MDLNEKIAARRKEMVIEQEKAKQSEKELNAKIAAERNEAIGVEVNKRLAEQGIEIPSPRMTLTRMDKLSVDKEVDSLLDKAATDRMTSGENTFTVILVVVGIVFLFIAWPLGIGLIIWGCLYGNGKRVKYRAQIIDEGKARVN